MASEQTTVASSPARYLFGPLTPLGLIVLVLTVIADQASKLWLLFIYDLPVRGGFSLGPYFDIVLTWNTGISYGLFPQQGTFGQWTLLGIKVAAVVLLWVWLARAGSALVAVALGLIIGGAIGNAIDRAAYGAVVDFVLFHVTIGGSRFNWYVFNLADAGIVAGVAGILYDSLIKPGAAKDAAKAP
jgi:signal peptidase II